MSELKACPFCNGEGHFADMQDQTGKFYYVTCEQCQGKVGPYSSTETAKTAWNTRALSPECERCDNIEKWADHVGCTPKKFERYDKLLSFVQVMASQLDDEQAKELLKEIGE